MAWRGVAQRRNRVFALLDTGDWTSRPPILLERDSLRGDTPPSRETRQEIAGSADESAFECSGVGEYEAAVATTQIGDIAMTLTARHDSSPCADRGQNVVAYEDICKCLLAGGQGRQDYETETVVLGFAQNTRDEVRLINGDGKIAGALAAETGAKQQTCIALAGNTIGRQPENGGNGTGYDGSGAMYTLTSVDRHGVAIG